MTATTTLSLGPPQLGPGRNSISLSSSHELIPIAQLSPPATSSSSSSADGPSSRHVAIRGTVGVTWPYSAVTHTIAFVLADSTHNAPQRTQQNGNHGLGSGRKRRRDEVRVAFIGKQLARAVVDSGVGPGDDVLLSLNGAEWIADATSAAASVPWQLRFKGGVTMEVVLSETSETRVVDVRGVDDAVPGATMTNGSGSTVAQEPHERERGRRSRTPEVESVQPPEPPSSAAGAAASRPPLSSRPSYADGTYSSPAFLKRARLSYGALFEEDGSLEGEDGNREKPRRKKPRFSEGLRSWRVVSRETTPTPVQQPSGSPSSPPEPVAQPEIEETSIMVDESVQTDLPVEDSLPQSLDVGGGGEFGQLLSPTTFLPGSGIGFFSSSVHDGDEQRDVMASDPPMLPDHLQITGVGTPMADVFGAAQSGPAPDAVDPSLTNDHQEPTPEAILEEAVPELPPATFAEEEPAPILVSSPPARLAAPEIISLLSSPPRPAPLQAAPVHANFGSLHWNIRSQEPEPAAADHHITIADELLEPPLGIEHPITSDAAEPIQEGLSLAERNLEDGDAELEAVEEVGDARIEELLVERGVESDEEPDGSELGEAVADVNEGEIDDDVSEEDVSEGDEEEDEDEEDEEEFDDDAEHNDGPGSLGDYDATNYEHIDPDDDEDMPEEQRVYGRQHQRGEYYEEDEADYDAEGDFDDEDGREGDAEEEYEEDEEPDVPPPQKAPSGPIVIDLLSDSEEEAENSPPPRQTKVPIPSIIGVPTPAAAFPNPFAASESRSVGAPTTVFSNPIGASGEPFAQGLTAGAPGSRGPSPSYAPPPKDEDEEEEEEGEDEEVSEEEDDEYIQDVDGEDGDDSESSEELDGDEKKPALPVQAEAGAPVRLSAESSPVVEGEQSRRVDFRESETTAVQEQLEKDTREGARSIYRNTVRGVVANQEVLGQEADLSTERQDEPMADAELLSMEQDLEAEMALDPRLTAAPPAEQGVPDVDMDRDIEEIEAPGPAIDMNGADETELSATVQHTIHPGPPPATTGFGSDGEQAARKGAEGARLHTTQFPPITPMATHAATSNQSQLLAVEETVDDGGRSVRLLSQEPADNLEFASQEVVEDASEDDDLDEEDDEAQVLKDPSASPRELSDWELVSRADAVPDEVSTIPEPELDADEAMPEEPVAESSPIASYVLPSGEEPATLAVPARSTRSKTSLKSAAALESSPPLEHDSGIALARTANASKKLRSASRKSEAIPPPATPASQAPVRHMRSRSKQISPESASAALALSFSKDSDADVGGDTSVALAHAALNSGRRASGKMAPPSKDEPPATIKTPAKPTQSAQDLKKLLVEALATDLQEYVPLRSIRNYQNNFQHVVGVVVADPKRPPTRTARREYSLTFSITDPDYASAAGNGSSFSGTITTSGSPGDDVRAAAALGVVEVQIFRPFKESLPVVAAGDAILLREFLSLAARDRGFVLRSGDASAWAVVDEDSAAAAAAEKGSDADADRLDAGGDVDGEARAARAALPQIRGAPVEVSDAEMLHMARLRRWFALLGPTDRERLAEGARRMDEAEEAAAAPGRK